MIVFLIIWKYIAVQVAPYEISLYEIGRYTKGLEERPIYEATLCLPSSH
jgi:hypothetical protein